MSDTNGKLAANVSLNHPETGDPVVFGPDSKEIPDWAIAQITNPGAWAEQPDRSELDLPEAEVEASEDASDLAAAQARIAELEDELRSRPSVEDHEAATSRVTELEAAHETAAELLEERSNRITELETALEEAQATSTGTGDAGGDSKPKRGGKSNK